jgi:hypothetical protein
MPPIATIKCIKSIIAKEAGTKAADRELLFE